MTAGQEHGAAITAWTLDETSTEWMLAATEHLGRERDLPDRAP